MERTLAVAEVPAGRGVAWVTQAFHLFRRQPFAWIGLCSGWLVITFVLMMLPLVGGPLASFLQPAFFASFAMAARKQEGGGAPLMADLFAGFKRNLRALVMLGAILSLLQLGILALMVLLGLPTGGDTPQAITIVEYVEMLKGKEWILAVGFVLTVAAKGALWFAPQLIAFHDMSLSHAARWSVYAALSNIGAMMVYGTLFVLLFFFAMIPWGLGLLVAIPMMAISTYVGYREVFEKTLGDRTLEP
jgi:uncharacterized membrane protein